jgi:shikimate dehydrogenase
MRTFGIVGYPLLVSFSQPYFQKKFEEEQIKNCEYLKFPIANIDEFTEVWRRHPHLIGFNVTIPHKQHILKFVHQVSDVVKQCGATNCIKITNGQLTAYNTDVIGFEQSLQPLLKVHHRNAFIFGTGGAAVAVAYVLRQLNISYKYVSRSKKSEDTIRYSDINAAMIRNTTLLINASPAGMMPNEDTCPPIPYDMVGNQHLLYDLVYKPDVTLFLQKGKAQGAVVKNGFEMLILQAEAAWKIWNE